jgi:hypothetical protein
MSGSVEKIIRHMQRNPRDIGYSELCKVCDHYFGEPRQSSSSHRVYQKPWEGEPRVNIQSDKGKAKPYQVRQVLEAISKLEAQKWKMN